MMTGGNYSAKNKRKVKRKSKKTQLKEEHNYLVQDQRAEKIKITRIKNERRKEKDQDLIHIKETENIRSSMLKMVPIDYIVINIMELVRIQFIPI